MSLTKRDGPVARIPPRPILQTQHAGSINEFDATLSALAIVRSVPARHGYTYTYAIAFVNAWRSWSAIKLSIKFSSSLSTGRTPRACSVPATAPYLRWALTRNGNPRGRPFQPRCRDRACGAELVVQTGACADHLTSLISHWSAAAGLILNSPTPTLR